MTTITSNPMGPLQGNNGTDKPSNPPVGASPSSSSSEPKGMGAHAEDDMLARVKQGAHDTIDRVADSAAPHMKRLQEGAHSASEALHERSDQARELGEGWTETVRHTVREHPLAALAAALVAGMVIARMNQH